MENTLKPTHKVSLYGAHCYFNEKTGDLWGVSWLDDYLAMGLSTMHNAMAWMFPGFGEDGFPLKIIEEYR